MTQTEQVISYCPHCGKSESMDNTHRCFPGERRMTALILDVMMAEADDPIQLLWLVRVAHRLRQSMNGLEKYRERAGLAREVIRLFEEGAAK